jgi:hypothetical protein
MANLRQPRSTGNARIDYLIAEFRCGALRAQFEAGQLETLAFALAGGLVTPEQALDLAADCGCDSLRWIEP